LTANDNVKRKTIATKSWRMLVPPSLETSGESTTKMKWDVKKGKGDFLGLAAGEAFEASENVR
jgi:hypothetical protein